MKSEKLSTKDWKSSRLRIIGLTSNPHSSDRVNAECSICGGIKNHVLSELIRLVNRQANHTELYTCSKCFRKLDSYREKCRQTSQKALSGRTAELSARSKAALARPEVRQKIIKNANRLSSDAEFKKKVSNSIKLKFRTDASYVERVNNGRRNDPIEFIARCDEIHDRYYDYSSTVYVAIDLPFHVICPNHGIFSQLPSNHIKGHGCPKCAAERSRLSSEEYFRRCSLVHGYKYDYLKSQYTSSSEYIDYTCPQHGLIRQLAQNHLKGSGCRFCDVAKNSSKGETEIAEFVGTIRDCERHNRSRLLGAEIDILAGEVGVEYHGIYWHSYNRPETTKEKYKHQHKADLATREGLQLLQIYETEWIYKQSIIKSILRAKLGAIPTKIYARNCGLVPIKEAQAARFFGDNHLQGHRRSQIYSALVTEGEIVCAASFTRMRDKWELIRFCSALDTLVVGGLSRILGHVNLGRIFTYADRRFSMANSYLAVGFKLLGTTSPGYRYCKGLKLYPRQMFQKHKLASLLPDFDRSKTEAENMFANGYRRIWDAGHWKLELT